MLGHRRRRWTNIDPPLGQCLVLLGQIADHNHKDTEMLQGTI